MASTVTGDMYTQEEYERMSPQERHDLGIVPISPQEAVAFESITKEERIEHLKKRKKVRGAYHDPRFTKVTKTERQIRKRNKAERQRRKQGRK